MHDVWASVCLEILRALVHGYTAKLWNTLHNKPIVFLTLQLSSNEVRNYIILCPNNFLASSIKYHQSCVNKYRKRTIDQLYNMYIHSIVPCSNCIIVCSKLATYQKQHTLYTYWSSSNTAFLCILFVVSHTHTHTHFRHYSRNILNV